jgi:hypothetical protein
MTRICRKHAIQFCGRVQPADRRGNMSEPRAAPGGGTALADLHFLCGRTLGTFIGQGSASAEGHDGAVVSFQNSQLFQSVKLQRHGKGEAVIVRRS